MSTTGRIPLPRKREIAFRIVKHKRNRKHRKWTAWVQRLYGRDQSWRPIAYQYEPDDVVAALCRRFGVGRKSIQWGR